LSTLLRSFFIACTIFCAAQSLFAQKLVRICGTVYDITARNPIEAVAVIAKSGRGAITDSLGRYCINVPETDSIWFQLIGKSTKKYAVDTITNYDNFNVSVYVRATELPAVKVRNNYYRYDSLQNRQDYAKYFDFRKPGLRVTNAAPFSGGAGMGFDLAELINVFRFDRTRRLEALQKRLIEQEHEKYVNYRFSKQFVRKITKLQSPELDTFMLRYRPDYEMVQIMNDLELGYYIQKCYETFRMNRRRPYNPMRRRDD